jgi:tetratricopeptide (TPR) repeat protein
MTRTFHRALPMLGLFAGLSAFSSLEAQTPPAEDPPPAYVEKLEEGQDLLEEGNSSAAVKALQQADKLAKGSCWECHLGLAKAFNQLRAYREVLKHVEKVLQLTSERNPRIEAYNEQGLALVALAGEDAKQLAEAEKAFRQVLELSDGKVNAARFNLGYTLLRMSRDAEGLALLKEYLAREPEGASAEDAKALLENPLRARKRLIPDFELVTLDGTYLTSEELRGKVVLLDFWGTWCPPCIAAIPSLRSMSQRMKKKPFVLVSISNDADEGALRKFVAEHQMLWPQVWDRRHELIRKLKIEGFPTYLLVSHEGEILYAASGWGPHIERDLNMKISSALRAVKRTEKASSGSQQGPGNR